MRYDPIMHAFLTNSPYVFWYFIVDRFTRTKSAKNERW